MFDVYLYDGRVGTLTPRGRGIRFEYAPLAVADERVPAISVSLPKRAEPYPDSKAGPFFRNLLPEQAFRRLVAAAARVAPEDSTALLGAIGGECPGAVSIWPAESAPAAIPEYQPLEARKLSSIFSATSRDALANAITRGRLSLAGAQDKVAMHRTGDGEWHLPLRGAVTSHILKQATTEFPGILENELFCMRLARATGIQVPDVGLASPAVRIYCVERFDRSRAQGGGLRREKYHQEDFCQALGVELERKYEADGGPGLRRCATIIRRYSSLPAEDLTRLVRWVAFNYLVGNEDAHAKNLALLYLPGELRLAPHYDLVSTAVYATLERRLAMKIGRAWDIRNVQRSDWRHLSTAVDVPWDTVRATVLDVAVRLRAAVPGVLADARREFGPAAMYGEIAAIIERQALQLDEALEGR